MKKIISVCVLAGLCAAYLYLLWHRQMSLKVLRLPKKTPTSDIKSYSLSEAPKDTFRATVATVSGTVKWIARTATGPAALKPETVLQQGEEVETGEDGETTLEFPDNSSVSLFPKTNIHIIQTLPSRIVYGQTAGKVRYSSPSAPVSVRIQHLLIILHQGQMDVSTDADSGVITVENREGDVSLAFNSLEYESSRVSLEEGQRYVFDDALRQGRVE